MNFQPPEPPDHGHCLRCGSFVIEAEQKNGICIDCQGGGAAFPQSGFEQWAPQGGMFLRDYFAAKVLAALVNHPNKDHSNLGPSAVPTLAKFAYEYADAMLAERAK